MWTQANIQVWTNLKFYHWTWKLCFKPIMMVILNKKIKLYDVSKQCLLLVLVQIYQIFEEMVLLKEHHLALFGGGDGATKTSTFKLECKTT
jgi:hypothetical protein